MRRSAPLAALLLVLCSLAPLARSQSGTTTVTAQVIDPNGTIYTNSPVTITFFDPGTSGKLPLLDGSTFQTSFPVFATDSFGRFTAHLADNVEIANSSGATNTQWRFNVCYSDGVTCFNTLITITGTTQDVSAALTAASPVIPRPGVGVSNINTLSPIEGGPITSMGNISCSTCVTDTQANFVIPYMDNTHLGNLGATSWFFIGGNTISHTAAHKLEMDDSASSPTAITVVDYHGISNTGWVFGNCLQADVNNKIQSTSKPCTLLPVQSYNSTQLNADFGIAANTLTTVVTVSVAFPASGCPCRAQAVWRMYYTTNHLITISNAVTDGLGHAFASSQGVTSASAATFGMNGDGYSPTTYANSANVTFTLSTQGGNTYTVNAAPAQGPGENTSMQIVVLPSN